MKPFIAFLAILLLLFVLFFCACQKEVSCENCNPLPVQIPGRVYVQDKAFYLMEDSSRRPYLQVGFPGNNKIAWYVMMGSHDHSDSVKFWSYQVGDEFIFEQ